MGGKTLIVQFANKKNITETGIQEKIVKKKEKTKSLCTTRK